MYAGVGRRRNGGEVFQARADECREAALNVTQPAPAVGANNSRDVVCHFATRRLMMIHESS